MNMPLNSQLEQAPQSIADWYCTKLLSMDIGCSNIEMTVDEIRKNILLKIDFVTTKKTIKYLHDPLFESKNFFINRGMIVLYEDRLDLRSTFKLFSQDYLGWFYYTGANEYPKLAELSQDIVKKLNFFIKVNGQLSVNTNCFGYDTFRSARPDLRAYFNEDTKDQLLRWVIKHGASEHKILNKFIKLV